MEPNLKGYLETMLEETETGINSCNYQAKESDIIVDDNGERSYSQEFLDNMPREFAMGIGRHSAIMDLLDVVDTQETLNQSLKSDLNKYNPDAANNLDNPRFQIDFEDEDGLLNN